MVCSQAAARSVLFRAPHEIQQGEVADERSAVTQ